MAVMQCVTENKGSYRTRLGQNTKQSAAFVILVCHRQSILGRKILSSSYRLSVACN